MSQVIIVPSCGQCDCPASEQIPGSQGIPGSDGSDGCNGINSTSFTSANFTVPAINSNVTASVINSQWMAVGQVLFAETAGYYQVVSKPTTTSVSIKNLGYTGNAVATTVISSGVQITPAGIKGTDGTGAGAALLIANNLSDVASAATSRSNLGATTVGANIFLLTNPSAITFLRLNADNTVSALTAAQTRTALALVPGTDIQVFDAFLTSIAALGTAANKMIYTTGVNIAAETDLTAYARTLLDDATALVARSTLGSVLPRYGVLGGLTAVDLNTAGDNSFTIEATRYQIAFIILENPSVAITTAQGGVFTAAGGGGTTLAAVQSLAALTGTNKFMALSLSGGATANTLTDLTLYFRVGTPEGSAATANVWVIGFSFG